MNTPASTLKQQTPARGAAALTVVMILFFIMALVAAYTNRNLIFEQRISANSYRAERALTAADAAVDWTLAMLNGGRIDANCVASTDAANNDFRRRYLKDSINAANGEGGYELGDAYFPACVSRDGALNCICPSTGTPNPAMATPADLIGSAFRVAFVLPGNAIRPGALEFITRGCASLGSNNTACYTQTNNAPVVDGLAGALTTVGLVRALPVPPDAALTAGGKIDASGGGELLIGNGDSSTGLTAHAGAAIVPSAAGTDQFVGPAGSTSDGRQANDATLAALAAAANGAWFRALFGMDSATYQRQPAVMTCPAGCSLADLKTVLAGHPRSPVWVNGDLAIDDVAALGSFNPLDLNNSNPLMLVVTGTLTVSGGATMVGFIHANNISWSANTATVQGAMVSATDFTATSTATVSYDKAVLDVIRLRYGSFVRVPGSWNLTNRN